MAQRELPLRPEQVVENRLLEHKHLTLNCIESDWKRHLQDEFSKPYFASLTDFLMREVNAGKLVCPAGCNIFSALNKTPLKNVKVVILGQDPYHGVGQAHGLSFSVPYGVRVPPSLRNIYQELLQDIAIAVPAHGNLSSWAAQGVLLLNSVLTVEQGRAASHRDQGWEQFTDTIIRIVDLYANPSVFLLWGAYAQRKGRFIDTDKHLVLQTTHPSPLSAHRGFLGSAHFSKVNQWLQKRGREKIDWEVPS